MGEGSNSGNGLDRCCFQKRALCSVEGMLQTASYTSSHEFDVDQPDGVALTLPTHVAKRIPAIV